MKSDTEAPFETADLNTAAFLICKGHEITATRVDSGSHQVTFVFNGAADADASSYFQNAALPARLFAAALRDLKGLVARKRNQPRNPNKFPEATNDNRSSR